MTPTWRRPCRSGAWHHPFAPLSPSLLPPRKQPPPGPSKSSLRPELSVPPRDSNPRPRRSPAQRCRSPTLPEPAAAALYRRGAVRWGGLRPGLVGRCGAVASSRYRCLRERSLPGLFVKALLRAAASVSPSKYRRCKIVGSGNTPNPWGSRGSRSPAPQRPNAHPVSESSAGEELP